MPLDFDAGGLKAILADPTGFGDDVVFGYKTFRGALSRDQRMQDDGAGFQVQVWVTTLFVQASQLPSAIKTDSVLTIGEQDYRVRRVGPVDAGGQRELLLTEK